MFPYSYILKTRSVLHVSLHLSLCVIRLSVHLDLSRSGARTAKNTYGVQSGWVAHGFTDNRLGCGMIGKMLDDAVRSIRSAFLQSPVFVSLYFYFFLYSASISAFISFSVC